MPATRPCKRTHDHPEGETTPQTVRWLLIRSGANAVILGAVCRETCPHGSEGGEVP